MQVVLRFLIGSGLAAMALCARARNLDVARQAVRDQLLQVAEQEYLEEMEQAESREIRHQALLELAETRIRVGRLEEALLALQQLPRRLPPEMQVKADLLQADLLLAQGQQARAVELLRGIDPEEADSMELYRVLQADLLLRQQQPLEDALAILESFPGYETSPMLQLETARLLREAGQGKAARERLSGFAETATLADGGAEARIQIAGELVAEGDAESALRWLDPILEEGAGSARLEMEAYPVLILAYEELDRFKEAADMIQALTGRIEDPDTVVRLYAREALNRIASGQLEEMEQRLSKWIAQYGDIRDLSRAQLALAEGWEEQGELERAKQAYDRYLSVVTDLELRSSAQLGLIQILVDLDQVEEAIVQARQVLEVLSGDDPRRAEALFALADAELRNGAFDRAADGFTQWLDAYPDHPDRAAVLLRSSKAFAEAGASRKAALVLDELRRLEPAGELAEKALLQKALLLGPRRVEQALGAFDAYLEAYPEGQFVADAMTEKGIAAYRLGLFDLAIREFSAVEQHFPDHPRVEQAFCLRGWAHYLKGEDAEAQRIGEAFLQAYPESSFESDVRLWLAEMAYNRGDYSRAAQEFRVLAGEPYPQKLRARAAYLAGRSFLSNENLEQALTWLETSLELAPGSAYAPEVLFYTGDALTELGRFDEAIVKFNLVLSDHPDHYLVPAALGRIGDCQYTLGEENPERYVEALNTYREVMESSDTPLELKLQATYKAGRALASLDRETEALELFLKASTGYRAHLKELPESSRLWFVRSVTDAAQYLESQEQYREAIRVYRQLASTSLEGAAEASRRIDDLRREHLILF